MIAPRQIGWSEKANLLWEISKQLDRLNTQMCTGGCPTTTTTSTTLPICNSYSIYSEVGTYYAQWIDCEGNPEGSIIPQFSVAYNLCARVGTLVYEGDIIDNGLCI
jgi:hypothetical protein